MSKGLILRIALIVLSGFLLTFLFLTMITKQRNVTQPLTTTSLNATKNNNVQNYNHPPDFTEKHKRIKTGDSLYSLLESEGISKSIINRIMQILAARKEKIKLLPKMKYEFISSADNKVTCLIELPYNRLLLMIVTDSKPFVSIYKVPSHFEISIMSGQIEGNLFDTCHNLGYGIALAYHLNSIFQWDIDFNTEIRAGDQFDAIVERSIYEDGSSKTEKIIAARFILRGKNHLAIGTLNQYNRFAYYNEKGESQQKAFLRSPLKFTRISSRFSHRRFHPILRIYRPHLGIDYAAPTGTPVLTTARGIIDRAGWDSNGGGRIIQIRHRNGYRTTYMHLSRYAKGIKKRVNVRQGQVIGYVGSTGLSTGPHLDYRVQLNRKYINPLRLKNIKTDALSTALLPRFYQNRDRIIVSLETGTLDENLNRTNPQEIAKSTNSGVAY